MHHEIKLAYGDTLTIHAPSVPPTYIETVQAIAASENIGDYLIFKLACESFKITIEELVGKRRTQNLVMIRVVVAEHLYTINKLTFSAIGRMLSKDHTTIMHYLQLSKNYTDTKDDLFFKMKNQLANHEKN